VHSPGPFGGERQGGVGLELTRRRLSLAFGAAARLAVGTVEDGAPPLVRTRAELVLPSQGKGT
jgi:hypothetical protein